MNAPRIGDDESRLSLHLGAYEDTVSNALRRLDADRIVSRIWGRDHTVWNPEPEGIDDRLGWLDLPANMSGHVSGLRTFAEEVKSSGIQHVVLFGMGGSSLAAEVLRRTCGPSEHVPNLIVLDSTIPDAVRETADRIDLAKTLFIVSSKSGTTIEPNVLYKYFRHLAAGKLGEERAGQNSIAITDSGTPLELLARESGFRRVFTVQSDVGGRFSALSQFGLLPSALAGVDIQSLLLRGQSMARMCAANAQAEQNPGALLGAVIGALAGEGRDKLTLIASPSVAGFGMWVDQLIAESTGKDGVGIVPIVDEPLMSADCYGSDRAFVVLRLDGDDNNTIDSAAAEFKGEGHPVVVISLRDTKDLGGEFFRWEFATALAASILGVQPFDQPNVQASKEQTVEVLGEIEASGELPSVAPTGSLDGLMEDARAGNYVAIMAYLRPTSKANLALRDLRRELMERYRVATTAGYGPQLLHSTGQLHKHGPDSGLFLQITSECHEDVEIPGHEYSFDGLARAQAVGDFRTLERLGHRVVRVDASTIPGLV